MLMSVNILSLFCLFFFLISSFDISFFFNSFVIFFNFLFIGLSRSHNLGHEIFRLTRVSSPLMTHVTCLSYCLGLTRADLFISFLSSYVLPKVFFHVIIVFFKEKKMKVCLFIIVANYPCLLSLPIILIV